MATIKDKNNTEEIQPIANSVDNSLELLKYTSSVQSDIKNKITSDFILCKLNEADKMGITSMTVNAYMAKKMIRNLELTSTQMEWNSDTETWSRTNLKKETLKKIQDGANELFNTYMTEITMCALLNRNVGSNYLIDVLAQRGESIEEEEKAPSIGEKLKAKFKKEPKKEETQ